VLETARHIEYIASAERDPVILPKPLDFRRSIRFSLMPLLASASTQNSALIWKLMYEFFETR
jgi:hypothetical protein